jgi:hypothetical protein
MMRRPCVVVVLVACLLSGVVQASDVTVKSIDALKAALRKAQPGDTVRIAPGTYRPQANKKVFWFGNLKGTPDKPITIRAADPENRPVFKGGNECFQLSRCSDVVVDGIIAEGADVNNLQFDFCKRLIVMNCISRNMTSKGNGRNCDGIKMPGCDDFLIYKTQVVKWGTGGSAIDMVGCKNGLIAKCRFSYPTAPGAGSANCTQPKSGTHNIGVYKNLFDDASLRAVQFGGAGKPMHLGKDQKQSGVDQVAMGNVINKGECAVVYACTTRTVFAYNTIVKPTKYLVRILKEGKYGPMSANMLTRNIIVYGRGVAIQSNSRGTRPEAVSWRENYWHNTDDPAKSIPKLPVAEKDAAGGTHPGFRNGTFKSDGAAAAYGVSAPGLDAAWAKHTNKFAWAWAQYQRLERDAAKAATAEK